MFELFTRFWKWAKWEEPRQDEMARLRALQMRGKGKKKHRFKDRPVQNRRVHRIRKR